MTEQKDQPVNIEIQEDEEIQDLLHGELVILQKKNGYRFSVDPILLTSFVDLKDNDRVVDLGTGTGVIPLVLAKREKERRAAFVGVEIQETMADMAERSVEANALNESIEIQHGDIRKVREMFAADSFDVVVSNPPYVPLGKGQVNPEDEKAQARHEVSVKLNDVVEAARYLIKPKGKAYFVYPAKRMIDLLCLCRENKLEPRRLQFVHANMASGAKLMLLEAMRDAGPDLKVLRPMLVYNMEGGYTEEVANILNEEIFT